jgi:hypothetical protein
MNEEASEMAVLSKSAYDVYFGNVKQANEELESYGLNYRIDEEHTDENSVTIIKPDGSAVIAYRGTDFTNPSDLLADFQILMGVHSNPLMQPLHAMNRFEDANIKYNKVKQKYGVPKLTGHSLGGAQALHVARRNNVDSIVFNPGSSPFAEPFNWLLTSDKPQTIYTTGDDPISYSSYMFDRNDNLIVVPRKDRENFYSHSLVNFLPPRRQAIEPPIWMNPVELETRQTVPFCEIYPELCGRKRA